MVPEGWKISTLGEVCESNLQTGPFGSQLHANEYEADGVPVLMPKDLNGFRANTVSAAKISVERARDLSKHRLSIGDILFSRRGDVTRFALIDESSEGSLCGTGCLQATPGEKHSPEFLAYFLQKHWVRKWLEQNAVGQTMPNMNTSILSELPLMVASSRQEEDMIAQILSTWDQAITATERLLENSQQRKKGLMQQLLAGKKRLPGFEGEWTKTTLGAIGKISSAGVDKKIVEGEKSARLLNYLDVFRREFIFDHELTHEVTAPERKIANCDVRKGDVFFTPSSETRKEVGIPAVAVEDMPGVVYSYHVVRFRPSRPLDLSFAAYAFQTDEFRSQTYRLCDGSGQRYVLSQDDFRSIRITVPDLAEQKAIGQVLKTASDEILALSERINCLRQEKKALMQQLLTGKRRVKVEVDAA